jgi:hypothetical protein
LAIATHTESSILDRHGMTAEEESGQTKQEQDEVRHGASILGLYGDESQAAIGEPNSGEPQAGQLSLWPQFNSFCGEGIFAPFK